ncbi:MAG: MGMT family protein [Mycoplasmataceae bacterium]|jgi:O-6-methylguanine DNA methyltransferase|nr:MGMT family protein [Mycoplasmataceae bacterium]
METLRNKLNTLKLTLFTKKVLLALVDIPLGQVRSYAQIATIVGQPGAARAVGSVCKNNPFPVTIPCHRVVPSKFLSTHSRQDIGNYSCVGGVKKKIALLLKEGVKVVD